MSVEVVTLTQPERKVLAALLDDEAVITDVVPEDSAPQELLANLSICCTVLGRIEHASSKLKPLIGRYLAVIRQKPDVYQGLGYASFEKFVVGEVIEKLNVSRSSVWEAKKIAEAFPSLQMSDYEAIGTTNLILASKITNSEQSGYKKVLAKAKEMTTDDFKEYVIDASNGEDPSKSSVVLTGSRSDINVIKKFIGNDKMKAYLEMEGAARMVAAAVKEAATGWEAEIADQERSK